MTLGEISYEVRSNFESWYARNFLDRRCGRVGGVSYTRPGELDDALAGTTRDARSLWYATAYDRAIVDNTEPLRPDEMRFILSNPLVALQLALCVTDLRGLRCYRRGLTEQINSLQRRSYRARYYARDNARRRLLAAERRKIMRRTTLNPCPTPEQFLEAFERRGESVEAKVRFGGMVHDLECYVDNCLRYDDNGEVCGRNGGIRAWIANNLPQLNGRYKTIMRYKALAKRLRQAAEIPDPVPTSAVYDGLPSAGAEGQRAPDSRASAACPAKSEPAVREVPALGEGAGPAVPGRAGGKVGGREYYASDSHISGRPVVPRGGEELNARLVRVRTKLAKCGNVFEHVFREVDGWLDDGC